MYPRAETETSVRSHRTPAAVESVTRVATRIDAAASNSCTKTDKFLVLLQAHRVDVAAFVSTMVPALVVAEPEVLKVVDCQVSYTG